MLDTDVPFRTVGCRQCRTKIVVLYHRDDRLTCDMFGPAITPGSGHTAPIEPHELIPADGDLPEWRSQYAGMTRNLPDPRGTWFGGIDVADETDTDPHIEVTCRCQGPHRVDLAAITDAARKSRKSWMPWPVS
jgi:hypothetical protein